MKFTMAIACSVFLFSKIINASTIAIIDSGNDFKHKDLISQVWINPVEIPGNDRDEDHNGYPDDVNGWNFAEGNNQLIDYSYAYSYNDDAKKFFEIQLKAFLGTITDADKAWYKEKIKDDKFIKNLTIFGNWMHGTHVTGIAAKNSPDARMMGIKLIPTEVKIPGKSAAFDKAGTPIKDALFTAALTTLAKQQSAIFEEIGAYLKNTKVDVANGSFGTPFASIENIVNMIFEKLYGKKPTAEETAKFTKIFFTAQLEETKKFLAASPDTLFVFAAGNEGTDNDVFPTSPTNVQADNKISVAAAFREQSLAVFSNYGINNVDVAAPGVGITSTIPMDHYLAVSGTSQASPYVANIAGRVKDLNPKLKALEIKRIILETVDVKSWLKGKVRTSGLVNRDRATRAAELSQTMDLKAAILQSRVEVLAKTDNENKMGAQYYQVPKELVLPLPNPFIYNP